MINPQWLAGFASGEGCVMVRIRNSKTSSKAIIELVFQINQHSPSCYATHIYMGGGEGMYS